MNIFKFNLKAMKKSIRKFILICIEISILLLCGFHSGIYADENSKSKSQLTAPWEEFKKLFHLDKQEIFLPLEIYQKLLAQTGIKTVPSNTTRSGDVILTQEEFKKLVDQMKPPEDPDKIPPFDYLITKSAYSGKMTISNTAFTGTFQVHVLKKDAYIKIPLLPQTIALEDIKINGKQTLIVSENGFHHIILSKPGEYEVTTLFSVKSSLEKGPHRIDFNIRQTPITLLKFEIPLKDIDIEIPQAQHVITKATGNSTTISAIINSGRSISIRWRKKVAVTEKIPSKIYSETYHLISIEDDALKISSDINYKILHSEIDGVRFIVPDDINILTVTGEGIGEWQETMRNNQRLILIPFTYGKKGTVIIHITSEKSISDKGVQTSFSGIRILDTVRETGFIGVELNTSAEVKVVENTGLERVAIQKLPQQLYNKSVKPLIHGFKYSKHPYSLVLDIKKHEKISVPVATINSGSMVTLITEDGKVVHRLVYQIRNSAKQFLELQLPETADIWSVFVGNVPVESSLNSQGKLLVPLNRSQSINNRLNTFPVEVIYCLVEKRFSILSSRELSLPPVDLLTSRLIWSIYLPNDYTYLYFTSTLEKEEMIRGLNILAGSQRQYDEKDMDNVSGYVDSESGAYQQKQIEKMYKGKDYSSKFRNLPLKEEEMKTQLSAELEFSGRLEDLAQQAEPLSSIPGETAGTGILPIHIEIPTGGQVYRFAKTIVKNEDPLTTKMIYMQNWIIKTLKWLIFVLLILIIYINKKTVNKIYILFRKRFDAFKKYLKKHNKTITKISQSIMTPFILFGIFVLLFFKYRFLSNIFLFLFWISIIYQIVLYRRRKLQEKSKQKGKT
jgi:hypothetical protein